MTNFQTIISKILVTSLAIPSPSLTSINLSKRRNLRNTEFFLLIKVSNPDILESEVVTTDLENEKRQSADEFMRNFFLKFDMKKTLEIFQRELYEK